MLVRVALVSGLILSLLPAAASADAMKILRCLGHNPMNGDISNRYVLNLTKKVWVTGYTNHPLIIEGNTWTLDWGPEFPQPPEGVIDATTLVMSHYGSPQNLTLQCHIDNS